MLALVHRSGRSLTAFTVPGSGLVRNRVCRRAGRRRGWGAQARGNLTPAAEQRLPGYGECFTKYQVSGSMESVGLCGVTPLRLLAISVSRYTAVGWNMTGSCVARKFSHWYMNERLSLVSVLLIRASFSGLQYPPELAIAPHLNRVSPVGAKSGPNNQPLPQFAMSQLHGSLATLQLPTACSTTWPNDSGRGLTLMPTSEALDWSRVISCAIQLVPAT